MKKTIYLLSLAAVVFLLQACDASNLNPFHQEQRNPERIEEEVMPEKTSPATDAVSEPSIFSPIVNQQTTVDKSELTDDLLLVFIQQEVIGSGYDYVMISFGDGTGHYISNITDDEAKIQANAVLQSDAYPDKTAGVRSTNTRSHWEAFVEPAPPVSEEESITIETMDEAIEYLRAYLNAPNATFNIGEQGAILEDGFRITHHAAPPSYRYYATYLVGFDGTVREVPQNYGDTSSQSSLIGTQTFLGKIDGSGDSFWVYVPEVRLWIAMRWLILRFLM